MEKKMKKIADPVDSGAARSSSGQEADAGFRFRGEIRCV